MGSVTQSKTPKLTVLLINKKTSERFFQESGGGLGPVRNAAIGALIADENICLGADFYLVSQYSNRGSILPNHYKVIYTNSENE